MIYTNSPRVKAVTQVMSSDPIIIIISAFIPTCVSVCLQVDRRNMFCRMSLLCSTKVSPSLPTQTASDENMMNVLETADKKRNAKVVCRHGY